MKYVFFAVLFVIIILVVLFFLQTKNNKNFISEKEALEIAKKAIGNHDYDRSKETKTELKDSMYYVAFPFYASGRDGNTSGNDAMRVQIDAKTGKVLSVMEDPN